MGDCLDPEKMSLPHSYIAVLDSDYFIKNDINLWEEVCSNGLFDIWNPISPYNRFSDCGSDSSKFRVNLLRIYEINEVFSDEDIYPVTRRIDHLIPENRKVTIKKPVIHDSEFKQTKRKLISSVDKFLIR